MRLALRLGAAFAVLTFISTAGLGLELRRELHKDESDRFDRDVKAACESVNDEVRRQGDSDRKLIVGACQSGDLVDRVITWTENGTLDAMRPAIKTRLVPDTRAAFDLDELMLVTGDGEVLGANPRDLESTPAKEVVAALHSNRGRFVLRLAQPAIPPAAGTSLALMSHCHANNGGKTAGLIGARHLLPLFLRLGKTLKVNIAVGSTMMPSSDLAQAQCNISDGDVSAPILVSKPKDELYKTWAYIDRTILLAGALSIGIAFLIAFLLAQNLGRPIAELAAEARKVATGEANPLRVRGSGEIAELVRAFDKMIEDLAATRRRLAATSRVAAWREVARRVAHEIKNPLAPIRAAVETLRRLRAREDPAFDEYFDEATRTVLDEVHRISTIVTEFTRFARLPPPRPTEIDVIEVARQVVQLQKANGGDVRIELDLERDTMRISADRDQIVQVLTNLVQNAVEAVRDQKGGQVNVSLRKSGTDLVEIAVRDNGPGVAPEMASRLFEPYATTKAQGTGLGLAIAQRIAMEHNGELSYSGASGGGALFRLVLPVEGPPVVAEMGPQSGS